MALGRLLLLLPDPHTLFKGPLTVPKRAAWSKPIPLPAIKAIGAATGATINDVLLACVAGALRRYLEEKDQPVEGLNVRGVIPVNLRTNTDVIELGNRFGLFFLALPLGVADPLDRLMELKRRMDDLKATPEAVVAFGILNAIGMAPTDVENLVVNIFGMKATAVMTNVPGPRQQVYFAGAAIDELMFWVPQSGRLGLGVSIFSYNNKVLVGFATDQGLVPDPEMIVAYYHDEVEALLALVQQAPPAELPAATLSEPVPEPAPLPAAEGFDIELLAIDGIGASFASKLHAGGITTLALLANSSPETLASLVQAPDWRRPDYAGWIEQARALAC